MFTRDEQGRARLNNQLLSDILTKAGATTPAYVYDLSAIATEARELVAGFGDAKHLIAYAVKANSAGPVLRTLAEAGCGAEVGSLAELNLALACGIPPDKILLSGVAKTDEELRAAITSGERGICSIQVDCVEELARIHKAAEAIGRPARVSLRINPNVQADTHQHIATGHDEAKFGIPLNNLPDAWQALDQYKSLELVGISSHIGSQLTRTNEYLQAADLVFDLVRERESQTGQQLTFLDFGGGFGIDYGDGCPVTPADFARGIVAHAQKAGFGDRLLVVEPGRALVGPHGLLVSSLVATKRSAGKQWLIIDAGMNDLMRPALYQARHRVEASEPSPGEQSAEQWQVVGPVCETSDDFGAWDFQGIPSQVVIRDAGAYGYTMASNYNGRGLPSEIFVDASGSVTCSQTGHAQQWIEGRLNAGKS